MGDEGAMDPCECIWGQEMAMRRLLSLLRQSQSHCTDSECYRDGDGLDSQGPDQNFVLMGVCFAIALIMYFMRPRLQDSSIEGPEKPRNDNNPRGAPPTPPPTF